MTLEEIEILEEIEVQLEKFTFMQFIIYCRNTNHINKLCKYVKFSEKGLVKLDRMMIKVKKNKIKNKEYVKYLEKEIVIEKRLVMKYKNKLLKNSNLTG